MTYFKPMYRSILSIVLISLFALPIVAQSISEESTVSVSGTGSVSLEPDFVTVSVGVTYQAKSADEAAFGMSERIDMVVDTLVALGIARDELPSMRFDISPVRDRTNFQTIVGYTASVSLGLQTTDLDRIASLIGAAVTAGATNIGSVQYQSTQVEAARQDALRLAVAAAKVDASTIADANHATLGSLIKVSSGGNIRPMMVASEAAVRMDKLSPATLTPQSITVTATVSASWRLLPIE